MSETEYQPAYENGPGRAGAHRSDLALARAMKQAAESAGRRATPAPAAYVSARGAGRRRRVLASAAAGTVCVLASGVVAAVLQLQPSAPALPAAPPSPRHSAVGERPGPSMGSGSASPSGSEDATPASTLGTTPTAPATTPGWSPPPTW
ncbi:hypothetical protein [Streptomyces sp. NBC_01306]|uniref:hypothetical protein n=1 Tax=Streptomyces sp. NBC_01306 TaxID=2903819 RepID=UPI0022536E63|nr:hypothetical protein [Streptomyces sp. NBC_01306]MCX4726113.1 hypothetical protein [Streptomyces sp. NBC_01306]